MGNESEWRCRNGQNVCEKMVDVIISQENTNSNQSEVPLCTQ